MFLSDYSTAPKLYALLSMFNSIIYYFRQDYICIMVIFLFFLLIFYLMYDIINSVIWRCIEVVITRTTRNRLSGNTLRGFESHHLRQTGALAQLGAHHTGSVGVRGSNPLCSTRLVRTLTLSWSFFVYK